MWLESPDPKTGKCTLHAVDDARTLVDKALALAVRAPRILLLHRRDRHHSAVPPLTAQPAQEYARQHCRIQTIRLRPPALAGHRNARRMDDMRLDPASNEPARQPEAVAASFIGQCNPPDRPASTHRLDAPPLDQSQQRCRIRLQLLQRLALDAGNNATH